MLIQMSESGKQKKVGLKVQPFNFHFRERYGRINWKLISALDVDAVIEGYDICQLQGLIDNLTWAKLDPSGMPVNGGEDELFCKLFRIAQLMLEHLLHCQEYQERTVDQYKSELEEANAYVKDLRSELKLADRNEKALRRELKQYQRVLKTCQNMLLHYGVDANTLFQMMSVGNMGDLTGLLVPDEEAAGAAAAAAAARATAHVCGRCGKAFASADYLAQHAARRHPGAEGPAPAAGIAPAAAAGGPGVEEQVRKMVAKETEELRQMLTALQGRSAAAPAAPVVHFKGGGGVDPAQLLEELRQKDAKITELKRLVDKEQHLATELGVEIKALRKKMEDQERKYKKEQERWMVEKFGRNVYKALTQNVTMVVQRRFAVWVKRTGQVREEHMLKKVKKLHREASQRSRVPPAPAPAPAPRLPPKPSSPLPAAAAGMAAGTQFVAPQADALFSAQDLLQAIDGRVNLTVARKCGDNPFEGVVMPGFSDATHGTVLFGGGGKFAPKLSISRGQFRAARTEVLEALDEECHLAWQEGSLLPRRRGGGQPPWWPPEMAAAAREARARLETATREAFNPELHYPLPSRRQRRPRPVPAAPAGGWSRSPGREVFGLPPGSSLHSPAPGSEEEAAPGERRRPSVSFASDKKIFEMREKMADNLAKQREIARQMEELKAMQQGKAKTHAQKLLEEETSKDDSEDKEDDEETTAALFREEELRRKQQERADEIEAATKIQARSRGFLQRKRDAMKQLLPKWKTKEPPGNKRPSFAVIESRNALQKAAPPPPASESGSEDGQSPILAKSSAAQQLEEPDEGLGSEKLSIGGDDADWNDVGSTASRPQSRAPSIVSEGGLQEDDKDIGLAPQTKGQSSSGLPPLVPGGVSGAAAAGPGSRTITPVASRRSSRSPSGAAAFPEAETDRPTSKAPSIASGAGSNPENADGDRDSGKGSVDLGFGDDEEGLFAGENQDGEDNLQPPSVAAGGEGAEEDQGSSSDAEKEEKGNEGKEEASAKADNRGLDDEKEMEEERGSDIDAKSEAGEAQISRQTSGASSPIEGLDVDATPVEEDFSDDDEIPL